RHRHAGPVEDALQRGTLVGQLTLPPQLHLGGADRRGVRRRLRGRVVPRAHRDPKFAEVDAVPRGERPAPVEDDRPDRHARILRSPTVSPPARTSPFSHPRTARRIRTPRPPRRPSGSPAPPGSPAPSGSPAPVPPAP